MPYDHKITDLKYRINGLVPKITCKKIINIFEKYPEFHLLKIVINMKLKKMKWITMHV